MRLSFIRVIARTMLITEGYNMPWYLWLLMIYLGIGFLIQMVLWIRKPEPEIEMAVIGGFITVVFWPYLIPDILGFKE